MWVFFLLAVLSIFTSNLHAQSVRYQSGIISSNTRWSGDIYIDGDIVVSRNVTLIIEPGTTIRVRPGSDKLRANQNPELVEIIIQGKLIAAGTEGEGTIIFTSDAAKPQMGDWHGIVFKNLSENSVIQYCVVEYAYKGITCYGASPEIENSEIRYNYYAGISCEVRAAPRIQNCTVSGNGFAGINCELAARPIIEQCVINQNTHGILIFERSQPDVGHYPEREGQSRGLNHIYNNFDFNIYNNTPLEIYAQNNIWNTEDERAIRESIYDREDNPASGEVIFKPIFRQLAATTPRTPILPVPRLRETEAVGESPPAVSTTSPPPGVETPPTTTGEAPPPTSEGTGGATTLEVPSRTPAPRTGRDTLSPITSTPPAEVPPQPPPSEGEKSAPEPARSAPAPEEAEPQIIEPVIEAFLDGGKRQYIHREIPIYPSIYKMTKFQGQVIMEVIVGRDGRVENYRVLRSDGEYFTEAAEQAIKKFVYKPGTVKGKPVKFRIIERFIFKLED